MPQDIPLEASDLLAFTPPSLAEIEGAPVFMLLAPTHREKKHRRRMLIENQVKHHTQDAIQAEVLKAVESTFPDLYEKYSGVIEAYWQAKKDFDLQAKTEPDLVWQYDEEVEDRIKKLFEAATQSWPPLGEMMADNVEYGEFAVVSLICCTVKSWTGLETRRDIRRGYLTIDCAESLDQELAAYEAAHGLEPVGMAAVELMNACHARWNLDKDKEKNSVSPPPSETTPPISTAGDSSNGKSPASASSTKTQETE